MTIRYGFIRITTMMLYCESKVVADDEIETTSNTSYVVTTEEGLRKALESDADESKSIYP